MSTVFGAGIVAAVLASSMNCMLEMLGSDRWWEPYVTDFAGGLAGGFLTLLLAAGIRRDVHLHRLGHASGGAPTMPRLVAMSITITVGLVLGKLLAWTPSMTGPRHGPRTTWRSWPRPRPSSSFWSGCIGARLLFSADEPTHAAHRRMLGWTTLVGAALLAQAHKLDAVLDAFSSMQRGVADVPGYRLRVFPAPPRCSKLTSPG